MSLFAARATSSTIPISPVSFRTLKSFLAAQNRGAARWLEGVGFVANPGQWALLPGSNGRVAKVVLGVESEPEPWSWGALPQTLPRGRYRVDARLPAESATMAALGWAFGAYRFERYRRPNPPPSTLVWPEQADRTLVGAAAEAARLGRDLINTPANDMGPAELAAAARALAERHGAKCSIVEGEALLRAGYPAIYEVGRASPRAPRLIDLRWGPPKGKKVTLVGKGVCFDSGGLDLKSAAGMKLMKKDMGGAATVLGLAHMVMAAELPVRLRVLIPAVENSVSGEAYRPLDVVRTRKGLRIEIGNTDAEGRVILADALAEADSEGPDLILDFATLTGAARIALGTDLPALFSNHEGVAAGLLDAAREVRDPLWRLPLFAPYRVLLNSEVADINNSPTLAEGGAISAALFLQEFVGPRTPWAHVDTMAWNLAPRPGRPVGGEVPGMRAAFHWLRARYGANAG